MLRSFRKAQNGTAPAGRQATYYLYDDPTAADTASFRPEYSAEFRALQAHTQQIISSAKFYPPVKPYAELAGKALHFTTTDINGNTVTSEELFGSHEITMLNVWASWCGPCIGELQELEALNNRLAGKDCAVIGLLIDGDDPDAVETARQILREKGVTYTVILPPTTSTICLRSTPTPPPSLWARTPR